MSKLPIVQKLEQKQLKKKVPDFRVGDTVSVHTKIIEGEKERTQKFTGTVIAKKGSGISETFTVHRVAYGEGMERVFPLHSPRVTDIEVVRHGKVRRAKLNYIRGTTGKSSKVKSHFGRRSNKITREQVEEEKQATAPEPQEAQTPVEEAPRADVAAETTSS